MAYYLVMYRRLYRSGIMRPFNLHLDYMHLFFPLNDTDTEATHGLGTCFRAGGVL